MDITIDAFTELLNNKHIIVEAFREHSKASEKYIDVTIIQPDGYSWKGSIPYFYRRTSLFIETPKDLVDYLNNIFQFLQIIYGSINILKLSFTTIYLQASVMQSLPSPVLN